MSHRNALIILASLAVLLLAQGAFAELRPEVVERIKPVGQVMLEGAEPAAAPAVTPAEPAAEAAASPAPATAGVDGEAIYNRACFACHASGAANAPKLGDVAAWAPRLAKGADEMYKSAVNGVAGTAMPPRGTCATCSDEELKAAVDFMMAKSK